MDHLIEEWCGYNSASGSFHTKNPCSRLVFDRIRILLAKTAKIAFCATLNTGPACNLRYTDCCLLAYMTTKSRVIKESLTIDTTIYDVNEFYSTRLFTPQTRLIEHITTEAAISTSVTLHDSAVIREQTTSDVVDETALRMVIIPRYVLTVPDSSWSNVDDVVSRTSVKCEDLITVVLTTLEKNFVACYCTLQHAYV